MVKTADPRLRDPTHCFLRNLEPNPLNIPVDAIAQKSGSESIVERAAHASEKSAKKGREERELPTLS